MSKKILAAPGTSRKRMNTADPVRKHWAGCSVYVNRKSAEKISGCLK